MVFYVSLASGSSSRITLNAGPAGTAFQHLVRSWLSGNLGPNGGLEWLQL